MAKTIIGMFKNQQEAENAIHELKDLNYNPQDISIIMRDVKRAEAVSENTGAHVAEGAATGAATGGLIGGLAGLLVGITAITVPGFGALLIGGPIATALGLTGAAATTTTGAVTGALAGGFIGALTALGIPAEEAKHYEEQIRAGGIMIIVPTRDTRTEEVRTILQKHNATDARQLDLHANIAEDRFMAA